MNANELTSCPPKSLLCRAGRLVRKRLEYPVYYYDDVDDYCRRYLKTAFGQNLLLRIAMRDLAKESGLMRLSKAFSAIGCVVVLVLRKLFTNE